MRVPEPSLPPGRVVALVGLLCLIWGSTWVVIQKGLADLPPLTAASARFSLAAAVMTVVAPVIHRRERGAVPKAYIWAPAGILNFAVSYAIVYQTETVLPSGLVSVLWAVFPLLMALSGHFFLAREQLTRVQAFGFVLGFVGVTFLFATDLSDLGPTAVYAALFLLLSPLATTVGNTLVKRYATGDSAALLTRNGLLVTAPLLVTAAVVFESGREVRWTRAAIGSVLYLGIVGTCVTFGLYFWLLRHVRASRLSVIAYITPCVALMFGWALNAEPVHLTTVAGTAAIVAGIGLATIAHSGSGAEPRISAASRCAASASSAKPTDA